MSWRAESLPWIALGTFATLTTCSLLGNPQNNSMRQNYYTSREQCLRDYDASLCRSTSGSAGYYGPFYRGARQTTDDPGAGRTALADGNSTAASRVVRGGFSSTARSGHGGYRGG